MTGYTFSSICSILGAAPLQIVSDPAIEVLLTDSRKLIMPATTLFFSLGNPQKSADQYIATLYQKGVRCFVTDKNFNADILQLAQANILQVEDTLQALQNLAAYHRSRFDLPVIGITGSNGKTMVKEWLNQLLRDDYNIVRSPKSYNSQYGVPLSVWQLNATNTLAIFEAGISLPGEMNRLENMILPQTGVFTFIGDAHAAGFENLEEKIHEKLQLFTNSNVLIYCADDELLHSSVINFKQNTNKKLQLFSWSHKPDSMLTVRAISRSGHGSHIQCIYQNNELDFNIPYVDIASVHNAITCCCVMLQLAFSLEQIKKRIAELVSVEMRLELKQGINNCSVINDSYNSDIDSLAIALDFLEQQQQHLKKAIILSDIFQSGMPSIELYPYIVQMLEQKNIDRLIGIGPEICLHAAAFSSIKEIAFYNSTDSFIAQFHEHGFNNETILLKGARFFQFEKISNLLEEKKHETVLEIDLNALRHNLKFYGKLMARNVKLMAMVKAFSYGSGSYEIANVLQHSGVDYLAVAYADEGVELRRKGIKLPILVMNAESAGFGNLLKYKLEPELYSFKITREFIEFLEVKGINQYPVHIKLDTGMHRLGFEPPDIPDLCTLLKQCSQIKVSSVFSHLAASGELEHDAFTMKQGEDFLSMASELEGSLGYNFLRHIANTSAIHRYPHLQLDMVRLGIGLYGVDADEGLQSQLHNVTTLRTTISQVKYVKKGESVGYSRRAIVENDTVIATVRLGYADGYPRILSNGAGKMLVNGQLVPVIGNVCMDMTMLNVTGLDVKAGDEVIVFGKGLPVSELAARAETIAYEILTGISQRVKRVYFEE